MRDIGGFISRYGPEAQSLFRSGLSVRIVLALHDDPASLPALARKIPGSTTGSIRRSLKRLTADGLVEESHDGYQLTNAGTILVRRLVPLIQAIRDPDHPAESPMVLSCTYHEYEAGVTALLLSGHALTILCALREGPLSRGALRDLTGARSTTLRTRIRLLTGNGYIREDTDGFALTPRGETVAEEVSRFIQTNALLVKQKEFWNNHYIAMLPDSAIGTLYQLVDVDVDFDTPESIPTTITNYYRLIARSDQICGISEWTAPQLIEKYTERVLAGKALELILNDGLLGSMVKAPSIEIFRNYQSYPNFQLRIATNQFWCGMTIADEFFVIKFYSIDGASHTNARLKASDSKDAIQWGLSLFDHFKARSKPLENYLEEYPDIFPSIASHPNA